MRLSKPGFRIRSSYEVAFSPDGQILAAIARDAVTLWSVPLRARLLSRRLLPYPSDLAFAPSGSTFTLKNTLGELVSCQLPAAERAAYFAPSAHDEGSNLAYLGDDRVVDGSWSGEIRIREAGDLHPRVVWREDRTMVTEVTRGARGGPWAFLIDVKHDHPDHERGCRILLSEAPDEQRFTTLAPRWPWLVGVALSPTASRLAVRVQGTAPSLQTVDLASSRIGPTAPASQGGTGFALAWSPDGEHLILVEAGGFSFRSASDLREVGWLPSPFPAAIAFSPKGDLVALGDWQAGLVAPWPDSLASISPRPSPEQ